MNVLLIPVAHGRICRSSWLLSIGGRASSMYRISALQRFRRIARAVADPSGSTLGYVPPATCAAGCRQLAVGIPHPTASTTMQSLGL